MSNISLTGKNWVYKKYDNNYVSYLKETFFLDEIVAQLLSIRDVDKQFVESFLKPSIKDHIPNPKNLKDMSKTTQRIIKAINNNEKIIKIWVRFFLNNF